MRLVRLVPVLTLVFALSANAYGQCQKQITDGCDPGKPDAVVEGDLVAPPVESEGEPVPEAPEVGDDMATEDYFSGATESYASASMSYAPNMIGDSSYGGLLGSIGLAGGDLRSNKIADNNSPLPQDRIFFNYNHFTNALAGSNDLDRFLFGVEKTFFCGQASIQLRVPFASGLNSSQFSGADNIATGTEFGNIGLALKGIVWQDCCSVLTAGLGITLPTGSDFTVYDGSPHNGGGNGLTQAQHETLFSVDNESVHLQPFVGYLRQMDRLFVQGFAQLDFDTNGHSVSAQSSFLRGGDDGLTLQEQNLLFLDLSVGYWLYQDCCPGATLSGVAGIFEMHYTSTISDVDPLLVFLSRGKQRNNWDVLNLTGALHFECGCCTNIRVGAVVPATDLQFYDTEVFVQVNRRF